VKIIALDEAALCAGLRAVASEAEDVLARLPPAGDCAPVTAGDPSRDILLRADPSATVAFYPLPDGKLRLSCGAWVALARPGSPARFAIALSISTPPYPHRRATIQSPAATLP
jgi:hypothetical protein